MSRTCRPPASRPGGRLVPLADGGLLADACGIPVVSYAGGVLLLAAAATGLTAVRRRRPAG